MKRVVFLLFCSIAASCHKTEEAAPAKESAITEAERRAVFDTDAALREARSTPCGTVVAIGNK